MRKRFAGFVLAALIMMSSVGAYAVDPEVTTSGSTGTTELELTVAATRFSVTVPMSLPIEVDLNGVVSTASTAKITNNSFGQVEVKSVSVTGSNGWSVINYNADMSTKSVGTKEFGFKLNNEVTTGSTLSFTQSNFPVMAGKNASNTDDLLLTYDAKIPAQSGTLTGVKIAEVVFTVGWKE